MKFPLVGLVLVGAILCAAPLAAETVWILQTGPLAVSSIPLDPVQPVKAWRGSYQAGAETCWVYVTRSPNFFPPAKDPTVRGLGPTGWTVAAFFPEKWKADQKSSWLDLWVTSFEALATLPNPGAEVVFPGVLRKE